MLKCDRSAYNDFNFDGYRSYTKDEKGNKYVPATCKCQNEVVEAFSNELIDFIARGLEKLDDILCQVVLSAVDFLIEGAITALPGGQIVRGASWAVKAAKSVAENGMTATDLFGGWVSQACKPAEPMNIDLLGSTVYPKLLDAPDAEFGASVGCVKKKGSCKQPDKKPPANKDGGKPTGNKDDTKPTPTNKPSETNKQATQTADGTKQVTNPPKTNTGTKEPTRTDQSSASKTASSDKESETDCAPCRSQKVKKDALEVRWGIMYGRAGPQCAVVEEDDPEACNIDDGKSLNARGKKKGSGKENAVELVSKFTISFGKYAPCAKAMREPEIAKAFLIKNDECKTTGIRQIDPLSKDPRVISNFPTMNTYKYHSKFPLFCLTFS